MRYQDIETKFETPEGIVELLNSLEDDQFKCINYHTKLFRSGGLTDPGNLQVTLEELTGVYMQLMAYFSVASYTKKHRESNYIHNKKIELGKANIKPIVSILEREAEREVKDENRILTILQGKLDACEKGISTCQSKIKLLTVER